MVTQVLRGLGLNISKKGQTFCLPLDLRVKLFGSRLSSVESILHCCFRVYQRMN